MRGMIRGGVVVAAISLLAWGCGAGVEDELDGAASTGELGGGNGKGKGNGGPPAWLMDGGAKHVEICHVPPGNPARARTIRVGFPATIAHEGHGDVLAPCPPAADPDAGTPDPDAGTADPDAGSVN